MATYSNITDRADRRRRFMAIIVTLAFHGALLAFFLSGNSWQDIVPSAVKDVLGMEDTANSAATEEVADIRP